MQFSARMIRSKNKAYCVTFASETTKKCHDWPFQRTACNFEALHGIAEARRSGGNLAFLKAGAVCASVRYTSQFALHGRIGSVFILFARCPAIPLTTGDCTDPYFRKREVPNFSIHRLLQTVLKAAILLYSQLEKLRFTSMCWSTEAQWQLRFAPQNGV